MRNWIVRGAAVGLLACSTVKVYKIDRLDFPNKSGKLDNGLRVVVQPEPSLPYAVVTVRYDVGAGHDPADKKGLAHLVEHLAFRLDDALVEAAGKPTSGAAAEKPLRKVNYLARQNAYTSMDETVYWKEVVPFHLKDVLKGFAEQMADFSPRITQQVFETERNVVKNERRSSYETRPLNRWILDLYARLFPHGHPYRGEAVIGSHETISAITLADVSAYLSAHYHPCNATLVVTGPVSADATLGTIIELFGTKPRREPSKLRAPAWTPEARRERIVVPDAKETLVTVAWPAPPRGSNEVKALNLISDNSWFWYRLVHNRGWAYWAYSDVIEGELESIFVVEALLKEHDDVDTVVDKILEIAELVAATLDEESIGQARRRRIYRDLYASEPPRARADALAEQFARFGKPMTWVQEFDSLLALQAGDVRAMGKRILDADRALVLIHTPVSAGPAGPAADYQKEEAEKNASGSLSHDERDLPPEQYAFTQPFDEFRRWAGVGVESWEKVPEVTLANGVRCRIVQNGSLPIMYLRAAFGGGERAQAPDKSGTAYLTVNTMRLSGSADRMSQYLMGLFAYYDVEDEAVELSRKFLSFYANDAMRLFAEQLTSPKYLAKNVAEEREAYIQSLGDSDKDVDTLAARAFWKARGLEQLSPVTTKAALRRITLADVEAYHQRVIYPENMVLTVASNLPVAEVRALVEQHFGAWSPAGRPAFALEQLVPGAPGGDVVVVSVDGSAQTKIMVGFEAAGWRDWRAMLLADAVARLLDKRADRLREAMGVTYGTNASAWAWADHGLVAISTKVERDATDRAVKTLLEAIDRLRVEPIAEQQADFVRRVLIDSYGDSDFTAESLAANHTTQMKLGRTRQHYREVVDYVASLTRDDLQKAVDTLLARKPSVVIAGKDPTVPELGGTVRRYSAAELLD